MGFILYTDSATSQYNSLGSPKTMHVNSYGQVSVEGSGRVYYGTGCNEDLSVCDYQSGGLSASYFNSMFYCQYGGCQYSQVPRNLWTATWQQYWSNNKIADANGGTIYSPNSQLTVTIDPQSSGTVASAPDSLTCNGNTCQENPTSGLTFLTPSPSTGYAFGYWYDGISYQTNIPLQVNMNSDKSLTAKFFRTFRNTINNFQITTGDECVIYVRNETEIPYSACHGEAADCFDQAKAAGYDTGNSPKEGAIIAFDRVPGTALDIGHVGVVTSYSGNSISMHDSNWVGGAGNHIIGNHTETVGTGGYTIKGYIYYTPNQP